MVEALPIWTHFPTLGLILGHELTHGFKRAALLYALAEKDPQSSWMADFYIRKTYTCFEGLFKTPPAPRRFPQYYDEAIADYVSIWMTWSAMNEHLKNFPNAKQYLPTKIVMQFDAMMFFMQAYMRCHAQNWFTWTSHITHPPGFHRTNRGFGNCKLFQTMFQCEPGDPMVPESYCTLFTHDDEYS